CAIDDVDGQGHQAPGLAAAARTQQGVDYQIRGGRVEPGSRFRIFAQGNDFDAEPPGHGQLHGHVFAHPLRVPCEKHLDPCTPVAQVARRHHPVAAVVASAGKHHRLAAAGGDQLPPAAAGHGETGVFHEDERRDAVPFDGGFIDGPHFGRGDDPHGLPPYRLSAKAWATATAPSWARLRWMAVTPFSFARRRAAPCRRTTGSPDGPCATSMSRQPTGPQPQPKAFMTASLAAKRAARHLARSRRAMHLSSSAGVKTRSRKRAPDRARARSTRATSTTSTPMPTTIPGTTPALRKPIPPSRSWPGCAAYPRRGPKGEIGRAHV